MQHVGDEKARQWLKIRIGLVAAFFVFGFLAVIGRVYYLQTVEAEALQQRTAVDLDREVTRQARRGDIRDQNGVELAVSVEVPSIYARPQILGDPAAHAPKLAEILGLSEQRLLDRLDTDQPFVWLQRQTHPSAAEAIEELALPGLGAMTEYKRYYPMRQLAGQLLGFVGIDGEGLEGLERQFNDELSGGTYDMTVSRDARGRPMLLSDAPQFGKFEGNSLHLTVDEKVQRTAEQALADQVEEFGAQGGYAVAMDVKTGAILAMASAPAFDPNRINDHESSDWRLGPLTDTLEPGSVFKPFLVAAALQEEAVTLDTEYDLEGGRIQIGGYSVRDVTRRDKMSVTEVIQMSSNVGSYKIARDLGRDEYYDYIRAFGFGSRTGLGLRGEQAGVVWPPDQWAEITFANVAFGQGLTVTPLQVVTAVSALANGGMLLEPRIVEEIRNRDGETVWRDEPTMVRRVLSPEVSEQIAWAMSTVTLDAGTGTAGALEHFTVAAKTGTAHQVNPETRRYGADDWISGFVGFAPAESPEVAIAVFVDRAESMRYGGTVAGPAFAEIAEAALAQRDVLPLPADERFDLGDEPPVGMEDSAPLHAQERIRQWSRFDASSQSRRVVDDSTIPDFHGLTLRQALEEGRRIGLIPNVTGWGRVTAQQPEAGTPIEEVSGLSLTLSPAHDRNLGLEPSAIDAAGEEN